MRPSLAKRTPEPDRQRGPGAAAPVPEPGDALGFTAGATVPLYLHRDGSASVDSRSEALPLIPRFLQSGTSMAAALGGSVSTQPLTPDIRERFERSLDTDLSAVRVHTDRHADRLADGLQAEAFTVGSDIYFRAGRYDPSSSAGARLLAHETVHTVQQSDPSAVGSTGTPAQSGCRVIGAADPLEREAARAAELMTSPRTDGQVCPGPRRAAMHPAPIASSVIQRQESPPEAQTFGPYVQSLMERAEKEFERKKAAAKRQLDQLILRIKQMRVLRQSVQDALNALKIKKFYGQALDEREREQYAHLTRRLAVLTKEIADLQQQAIDRAIIVYQIRKGRINSIRRADNEDLIVHGMPKFGELDKDTGEVSIYGGAFESPAKLGSVIGHEVEAHGRQVTQGRSYIGTDEGPNLGFTLNEIEARDYEIENAERFGTSAEDQARTKQFRADLVKTLPPDYQTRVNERNYTLKAEDLANEEVVDPSYPRWGKP
jgi:hypothetical protein